MQYLQNKELTDLARTLRKNMTDDEKHLWYDFLRDYPVKFYRQRVVGAFILDFYCSKASLAIELDGNQHYSTDKAVLQDQLRTDYLNNHGIYVMRFSYNDIKNNFRGVCEMIDIVVNERLRENVSHV